MTVSDIKENPLKSIKETELPSTVNEAASQALIEEAANRLLQEYIKDYFDNHVMAAMEEIWEAGRYSREQLVWWNRQ